MEGFMNRGWGPILPGCGEIVGFPRGESPAVRPSPLIGRGRAVRELSANGIGARKTLG